MFWHELGRWALAFGVPAFFLWPLASTALLGWAEDRVRAEAARRARAERCLRRVPGEILE